MSLKNVKDRLRRRWPLALATVAAVVVVSLASRPAVETASKPAPVVAAATGPQRATDGAPDVSANRPIGYVDVPAGAALIRPQLRVSGWALDAVGIDRVEIRIDGEPVPRVARYGLARPDVAQVKPGYPDSDASGFAFEGAFTGDGAPRTPFAVVAVNRSGGESVLARKSMLAAKHRSIWAPLLAERTSLRSPPFYFLMATSGVGAGGAREIDTHYRPYGSETLKIGMRIPILYLRTTKGAAADWQFDPGWDVERRCGERKIAEDSLSTTVEHAVKHRIPVLFTLNGGVWADATCDVPAWDINDRLEQDKRNCQWNESNEVMADDYLRNLPGSQDAPELARSLTFNVYASSVRSYKKRNLQQAGVLVAKFAREHPELFVGVTLDPDTYHNPFFEERQWYDYNPGTLRQFRDWLRGSGPYAGKGGKGLPDLRAYRRPQALTLQQVSTLAGRKFSSWDEVDPPRRFSREAGAPFWKDAWGHQWELFRRHLVDLHYDELSRWLVDAGIGSAHIYSSQGFMAPTGDAMPFAVTLQSPSKNYDSGGMSVEGAIPARGHLGAILYGPSALNEAAMENGANLFSTFSRMDPKWAVVEYNTADLRHPTVLPTYAQAYRGLREVFNHGARFLSPMAWNGSNGLFAGQQGYVSFTAWRNTPLEEAMLDFALSHADLPLGSRLWTFGTAGHADADGWTPSPDTTLQSGKGHIEVASTGKVAELRSPESLVLRRDEHDLLIIGLAETSKVDTIEVEARGTGGSWQTLAKESAVPALRSLPAGVILPLAWPRRLEEANQVRIRLRWAGVAQATRIERIALYPRP